MVVKKTDSLKKIILKELHNENSFQSKSTHVLLDNLKFQKNFNGERNLIWRGLIARYSNNQDSLLLKIDMHKKNMSADVESYDILSIRKENIINNITLTYNTYLKCSWKNEISFDTYCQYLLPYKINKEPFISNWRSYLLNRFLKGKKDSIFNTNLAFAATEVHKWLYSKKNKFKILGNEQKANIPELSADILDKLNFGTCHQITVEGVSYMRVLGIPAAIDFAPTYLNINTGHEWGAVILDSAHSIPFDITSKKINNIKKEFYIISKVYRRTVINKIPV